MSISSVIIVIIVIEDSVIRMGGKGSMNSLGGSLQLPLVGE